MLRTKAQVDAHISNILGGLSTQDERLKRGYHFARLYFDIREFDRAEEYLQGFLTVKHNYAPAYKLLAQTYEATGKESQKIINAYKKCFELDPTQKESLLKICKLFASLNVITDEAKFWAEKAEKYFPNDADVFKLKVKANDMNQDNSSNNNNILKNIEFYEAESAKYPKDAMRKMKLLRLYMSGGKADEAYKLLIEAESQELFTGSYDWYKCLVEVLSEYKKCKKEENLPTEFYECYFLALCLYASLSVAQSPSITSATSVLWSLDQELCNLKDDANTSTETLKTLIFELKAHYLFLCGTLMLNKAQKEQLSWRTLADPSFACFLASMSRRSLDIKESWFTTASESKKPFLKRWYQLSCYRCSQIGHMLRKKYDDRSCGDKWLRRVQDDFFHNVGRNRICQMIYSQSESKESLDKSFFHKCLSFKSLPNLPNISDLEEWDGEVQASYPENLALLVWICLHYYDNSGEVQPDYPFALYLWLPSGCDHLESSSPDTLSQMDVQTYLMATVKCSAQNHAEQLKYCDSHQPYLLPFSINSILCSPDQSQWWTAVSKIKSIHSSMTQDAKVLENGLKTIRLIGTHGMNVELVSHLAKTWALKLSQQNDKLDSTVDFTEQDAYVEAQALHMWKRALVLIETLLNRSYLPPSKCLFEYRKTPSEVDLKKLHQEGQMFFAQRCKKSNNLNEALRILKGIKSAESFYEAAEIYKDMAGGEAGLGQPGDTLDEGKNDHLNQLTKAKDAYKSALELAFGNLELEKKIKIGLEEVESKLLNVQNFNDYEFVSELTDDCTYFGEAKFSCTPQKASSNVKSTFMTSSTPFAKQKGRNQNDLENVEIRLGSLTHYVDQRFKNMSEDNHKLLERIAVLESKIASLEAQKVMWTMPFNHMMPPSHLQIYPGGTFKHSPETDVRMQNHLMMDKFHTVIQPGMNPLQSGMVFPGFNNPQSIPNFRQNLPMPHQDIYKSPLNNQFAGNFLSTPGLIDADIEYSSCRGAEANDGLLPSIDSNFFPKYSPIASGGKSEVAATTPKSTIPVLQSMKPVASFAVKTPQSGSQVVCSNSSLAKLLTSPPTNATSVSSTAVTLKQVDVKNTTSTSSTPKNLFGFTSTVNQVQKIKTSIGTSMDISTSKTVANCVMATTEPKTITGGLTFNASPVVNKAEKVPETKGLEKVKTTTSNLFSNFSFGNSISASNSPFKFSFTSNPPQSTCVDVAAPQTSTEPVVTEATEVDNDESVEEYEPVGEFKLVSLPIVNVVTGEEDCNKLFGERGKLYRMDCESKQWKERGVGEIKILGNKVNKKARILMRRDQVLKVCANHFITAEMQLKSMDTSENSFCWMAMDYAEEEMRKEQFCIKFKTKEIALAFKECFESCQQNLGTSEPTDGVKTDFLKTSSTNVKKSPLSLADQFKSKDGEWNCKDCYVRNTATSTKCVSCESPKPGCENSSPMTFQVKSETQVMFGSQGGFQKSSIDKKSTSLADQFKSKDGEWNCKDCYVRNPATSTKCMSCESPKPGCENSSPMTFQVKPETQVMFGSQGGFQKSSIDSIANDKKSTSLADQFKAKDGEWSCNDCYVRNPATSTKCMSCESPKPGCENLSSLTSQIKTESKVTFGSQGGFQFGQQSSGGFGSIPFGSFAKVSSLQTVPSNNNVFGNAAPLFGSDASSKAPLEVKNVASASKFVFGSTPESQSNLKTGFSFFPPAVPAKPEDKTSGLTFSFLKNTASKDSKVTNKPSKSEATTSIFGSQFQGFGSKLTTVTNEQSSDLSEKSSSLAPFNVSTPTFTFAGLTSNLEEVPKTVAASSSNVSDAKSPEVEDELYTNIDGEDSHIQFEPIVKLPDNYEIKTFEEDETVLYENENAKIFRFHNNEWKEKGAGTVKLLRNENTGKVRVLMRRDKIHKICCNHYIMPDMQLHPLMNNKKALVWYAHDYVDGDQELQQLCIKFKTEEHAAEFKKHFLQIVEDMKDRNTSSANEESVADCVITYVEEPGSNLIEEAGRWMLPKNFYNYLNMPPCKGCIGCNEEFEFKSSDSSILLKTSQSLVSSSNAPSSSSSIFGTTLNSVANKPGLFTFDSLKQSLKSSNDSATSDVKTGDALAKNDEAIQSESKTKEMVAKDGVKSSESGTLFSFNKVNESFKSSPSSLPVFGSFSKTLDFGSSSKEGSGFKPDTSTPLTFSFNAVEKTPLSSAGVSGPGNVFGSSSKTLDFSSLSNAGSTFKTDSNFSWKGAGEKLFSSATPEKPQSATNEDQNEEDEVVEERDIHFEPIINLPEVEVTTGEEDELEIYKQRSMLYRFDGQWKERGVGEMKILKNKETGVYRLLLRREQIHKVVCNHLLTTDMNFKFMESSERALCWFANDFSEEPKVEQFALKFKTIDLAKEFLTKLEECQEELRSQKH